MPFGLLPGPGPGRAMANGGFGPTFDDPAFFAVSVVVVRLLCQVLIWQ